MARIRAVVIYCDASVPHHLRAGEDLIAGWGAVVIRGNVIVEASGSLPWDGSHSALYELQAAREALAFAIERGICQAGDTVYLASDCTAVQDYLSGTPLRPKPHLVAVSGRIRRLARHGLMIIAAHVKGHNGGLNGCDFDKDPHSRHNTRADFLAKVAAGARTSPEVFAARVAAKRKAERAERLRVGEVRERLNRERAHRLRRDRAFNAWANEL